MDDFEARRAKLGRDVTGNPDFLAKLTDAA
jgi:hypothetical protein